MRVTLDWDKPEIRDLHLQDARDHARQAKISARFDAPRPTEYWQSSGGEGFHFIEYDAVGRSYNDALDLREELGDDKLRLSLDAARLRHGSPFFQVLYHMKGINPRQTPPFSTDKRASLIERRNAAEGPVEFMRETEDGRRVLDYPAMFDALHVAAGHDTKADTMRAIRARFKVYRRGGGRTVDAPEGTRASARAYDLANGRRTPYPAERAALVTLVSTEVLGEGLPDWGRLWSDLAATDAYSNPRGDDRTAVLKAVQERAEAVDRHRPRFDPPTDTTPSQRAYDLKNGRRPWHPAEMAALYELAVEGGTIGEDLLAPLPDRTTLHEYFSVPNLGEFDGDSFERDEGESEWEPVNIRVGWWGPPTLADLGERTEDVPDMAALKAVEDELSSKVREILSPGTLDVNRTGDGISVEKRRPLDVDETIANRNTLRDKNDLPPSIDDPLDYIPVEMIWYEDGYGAEEWVLRGLIDPAVAKRMADTGTTQALQFEAVLKDTRGWW
jgi:hypothetical protein